MIIKASAEQDKVTKNTYRFIVKSNKGISGNIYLNKDDFDGIVNDDTKKIKVKILIDEE